jgi:hypothetical protein
LYNQAGDPPVALHRSGGIPSTAPVSSSLKPPKNRNPTILLLRKSCLASLTSAASKAISCAEQAAETTNQDLFSFIFVRDDPVFRHLT